MDRRKILLIVATIVAPLLISAGLPLVSGCGGGDEGGGKPPPPPPPDVVQKKKAKDGRVITKTTNHQGAVTYTYDVAPLPLVGVGYTVTASNGRVSPQYSDNYWEIEKAFNEGEDVVQSASRAAAVEREKLVPVAPTGRTPPPEPLSPTTGHKVDLPTQIYQPHQPSTSTPPTYTPPSGGTYHPH